MEKITKTGTTIVGLRYKSGIILAADTRSTSGPIVADKNIQKIHRIYDNIYACGAGTAADTDRVTRLASKNMTLFFRKYLKLPRVCYCSRMIRNYLFENQGYIGAALVLGGVDTVGCHLYSLHPHGYHSIEKFTSLGSGSLGAMGILEANFKEDMEEEDAINLACEAVKAGILNDMYSGSNVDVCILRQDPIKVCITEIKRNHLVIGTRENDEKLSRYPLNSITILKEDVYNLLEEVKDDL